jgi:thiamine biosynthesis lipoprotein
VVLGVHPPEYLARARSIVQDEIRAFESTCGRFRRNSELALLNRSAGEWRAVSPLLGEVIDAAVAVARRTGGAVDPTTSRLLVPVPVADAHDALDDEGRPHFPLGTSSHPCGLWRSVDRHPSKRAVRLPIGVHLDVSSIAGAMCVDRAARKVVAQLGGGALVRIGGDVAIAGTPPGVGWRMGLTEGMLAVLSSGSLPGELGAFGLATATSGVMRTRLDRRRNSRSPHGVVARGPDAAWQSVTSAATSCLEARVAVDATLVWGSRAPRELSRLDAFTRMVDYSGKVRESGGGSERRGIGDRQWRPMVLATA